MALTDPMLPAPLLCSLLRKKIANGPLVLARIAAKASCHKILKTIVVAFSYRFDVIQRGRETGKLIFAIATLVGRLARTP